jgi:branched-chain amino acid transport system substrate-binding protein
MLAGFNMQTALSLAVQDLNTQGGVVGKPVHLITYDSAGQAERGAALAERLLVHDCAAAIVGLYHNSVALAALEVAHRHGAPLLVAEAPADAITASEFPEVFRLAAPTGLLAQMPVQWLSEVGDYNRDSATTAVMIVESAANSGGVESVLGAFAAAKIDVEVLTVDLPSNDFSSVIARIVDTEALPDAIFIFVRGGDALTLQAQILDAGIGPQRSTLLVQQYAGLESDLFWQEVPNGVGTVVARIGPWHPTVTEMGRQFAHAYGYFINHWPEAYAFAAYDAVYLLADAITRAASLQGPALVVALEDANIELASGEYSFPYGSRNPPDAGGVPTFMWHQWPGVQTLYLQYTEPEQPADKMPVIWPASYRTVDAPVTHNREP